MLKELLKWRALGSGLPEGGAPYQQLVTDGEGVAKWEERLFYREIVEDAEIFPEKTAIVYADYWAGLNGATLPYDLIPGGVYSVFLYSKEYKCVCTDMSSQDDWGNWFIIGNAMLNPEDGFDEGLFENTGEPFQIQYNRNTYATYVYFPNIPDEEEHTFRIVGPYYVYNKLSGKYYNEVGVQGTGFKAEVFNGMDASKASGDYAHAEGNNTEASGLYAHAEGVNSIASGNGAHAECSNCTASGSYAHAEGQITKANGKGSHAEGNTTIANGDYQHVQGKYNAIDNEQKYAHIVGNGTKPYERSNAHTLDWEGNAWFAGTMEGTGVIVKSSTSGSTKRFLITVDDSGTLTATEVTT